MSPWQVIPRNKLQTRYQLKRYVEVSDGDEATWLKEVMKIIQKGGNKSSQLDILEVCAYPNSKLTDVARQCGLKAERFTIEDGDLTTTHGRSCLLATILLRRPKHAWLSPECRPWCAWNRFNAQRSLRSFEKIA